MTSLRSVRTILLALGAATLVGACSEGTQSPGSRPEPPATDPEGGNPAPLDLLYVCGNKFLATNATKTSVYLTFRVVGTEETGSLALPPGPEEDPGHSETELETSSRGTVELYQGDERVARRINEGTSCGAPAIASASLVASSPDAGSWSPQFPWPVVAIHLSLLPSGKVLSWGHAGTPQIWDPSTGEFTPVASSALLFCAGHTFLPDGRLLVSGGHIASDRGIPDITIFSPGAGEWKTSTPMRRGRWYPTATMLANGSVVIMAGRDEASSEVAEPEVWSSSGVRLLSGASLVLPYYPRTFLAPDGRIYYAGEQQRTRFLNPAGTGSWVSSTSRKYGNRTYGAAVMYEDGKILYAGGGRTTNTAEIVDLNAATPTWQWTGSMAFARRNLNATVLPTGEVLVTGGSSALAFNDVAQAIRAAEIWNPATGVWRTVASNAVSRTYHSTTLLLPDGRVLHTGSGEGSGMPDERNAEIYSPPYLFLGPRPSIADAPSEIAYGSSFSVQTAEAAEIGKVSLIRLGSVTHAFDMNQRFQSLRFIRGAGSLSISAPTSGNRAPPGHYMLFLVNTNGVPSEARVVKVGDTGGPPPDNAPPAASFLFGCQLFDCNFTDRSADPDGNIAQWGWDFGDGSTSTSRDPSHTYTDPGTYHVELTVQDGSGAAATSSRDVTVPGPEFPIALTASSRADATTQYVTLNWTGATGASVYLYRNGDVLVSTPNDGKHNISRTSTKPVTWVFKVCESASTICSNEVTVVFTGSPTNAPPVADFTSGCGGLACSFTDRSTDADGTLASWSWNFGDGSASTARNPSHTFAGPGTYPVALSVTDNAGASQTKTVSVAVSATATILLTASGREDTLKQYMTLRWTGATGATMDIYRNGARVVAGTPNDGKQTINKKTTAPATYVLKVCQGGTTTCSNEATLVFD
jgi:PKD repeat protein